MTNTQFNKLWDKVHKYGEASFLDEDGGRLFLVLSEVRYGYEVSLQRHSGHVIHVGHNKDRFREILVY